MSDYPGVESSVHNFFYYLVEKTYRSNVEIASVEKCVSFE